MWSQMSFLENNLLRRLVIPAFGVLGIPAAYLLVFFTPGNHPLYEPWALISIAFWVIISGVVYYVFLAIRVKRGTAKLRLPPRYGR